MALGVVYIVINRIVRLLCDPLLRRPMNGFWQNTCSVFGACCHTLCAKESQADGAGGRARRPQKQEHKERTGGTREELPLSLTGEETRRALQADGRGVRGRGYGKVLEHSPRLVVFSSSLSSPSWRPGPGANAQGDQAGRGRLPPHRRDRPARPSDVGPWGRRGVRGVDRCV